MHDREMIVTPHPLATAAGEDVLNRGGTAADAVVAVQAVLTLVEPQASGLGGGAFAVYHKAATGETITIDGREKAPAAATEDRFAGLPNFFVAWQSGLSVGVPGVPRLLERLHQRFGQLQWNTLFGSAQKLASEGFELSERTSSIVNVLLSFNPSCTADERLFFRDPTAFEYFVDVDTCTAKPAGTIMTNPALSETFAALANDGADAFYKGTIASAIVAAVQNDLNIPGDMTTEDLESYKVVEREPVCFEYRDTTICGMGPPSSGGLTVGMMLGILENYNLTDGPLDVETVHLFTQADRLAFADRNMFAADSDFVDVPVEGLLDKEYLEERANLITERDMGMASAGVPQGIVMSERAADSRRKNTGTSHISIVDRYGNALSLTSSIEAPLGNGVMIGGFLLNNELTDFSFAPMDEDGNPIANRVEANKRPRSSMSPTIVFDADGRINLLTGSVGGSRIIGHTVKSLVNMLDFGLDPQEAIDLPHFQNNNEETTKIEALIPEVIQDYATARSQNQSIKRIDELISGYDTAELSESLAARGHVVEIEDEMSSGLAVILVTDEGALVGGADKRRDVAIGGSNSTSEPTSSAYGGLDALSRIGFTFLIGLPLVQMCI